MNITPLKTSVCFRSQADRTCIEAHRLVIHVTYCPRQIQATINAALCDKAARGFDSALFIRIGGLVILGQRHSLLAATQHTPTVTGICHVQLAAMDDCHHGGAPSCWPCVLLAFTLLCNKIWPWSTRSSIRRAPQCIAYLVLDKPHADRYCKNSQNAGESGAVSTDINTCVHSTLAEVMPELAGQEPHHHLQGQPR